LIKSNDFYIADETGDFVSMILSRSHMCIYLLLLYILYKSIIFIVCLFKLYKLKFVIYLTVDETS